MSGAPQCHRYDGGGIRLHPHRTSYLLTNGTTNQEQSVGSCVPKYDANGNDTGDCVNKDGYAWSADGKPAFRLAGQRALRQKIAKRLSVGLPHSKFRAHYEIQMADFPHFGIIASASLGIASSVASSIPKCAITSSGGVWASHSESDRS